MESRFKHIDIAKGISISLVAMFHSHFANFFQEINHSMALFRMPLFFFLSGIFFSCLSKPKDFFIKKSESLLKPYFSVLLLFFIISILKGQEGLVYQLAGIFYSSGPNIKIGALWFLTHLFAVYCFCYILFKVFNFSKLKCRIQTIIPFVFIGIGSFFIDLFWGVERYEYPESTILPGLPFSLDIILITSAYFIIGFLLKQKVTNFYPSLGLSCLAFGIFVIITQYTNAHVDFFWRIYDYPVYSTLGALSGIYIILTISYLISKSDLLSYIPLNLGKASLYILIFHTPIQFEVYSYLFNEVSDPASLFYISGISYGLSLLIPLFIKNIIEKSDILSLAFLPFKSNKLIIKITERYKNKVL